MNLKRKINYSKTSKITASFILALIVTFQPLFVQAEESSELRKNIEEATKMLETVFENQYRAKEEELKALIMNKEYDYTMTMQSFYDQGNPFKDMDYVELIAYYASIKDYCVEHGIDMGTGITGIDFIKMSVDEKNIEEKIPVLYPTYEKREDGYYYKIGNQIITEETQVDKYEMINESEGQYQYMGKEIVNPNIQSLIYGDVTLSILDDEDIPSFFGIAKTDINESFENRKYLLDSEINETALSQSVFINLRQNIDKTSPLTEDELREMFGHATEEQKVVMETAISLLGQVPYEWGGKPTHPGYDNSWWTYNNQGEQKGLDCSGFVQWVYMTSGYGSEITNNLLSTEVMMDNLVDIPLSDLQPGDIGLLNTGEDINHTGIYLGNGYFIHCSSGAKTVVIDQFPFKYFKKFYSQDTELFVDTNTQMVYDNTKYTERRLEESISDNDVLLLSQLIENEAGNQGYNGWVAVGEVIMNRLHSDKFPDTLQEVIYDTNQFSNSDNIASITPRAEVMSVAKDILCERIAIFNNPDVLYFRNPMITDHIRPEEPIDWGNCKYYKPVNEHVFYTGN